MKSLNSAAKRHHETFWLCTRFMDRTPRLLSVAVLAIDSECYRIISGVNEAVIAQIRLQWWRDEISRLKAGSPGQLTLPGRSLSLLMAERPDLEQALLALIDAHDDVAAGLGSDYPACLFRLLFAVLTGSADARREDDLAGLCGDVFRTANAGGLNKASLSQLAEKLTDTPPQLWPVLCVFEFTEDWSGVRKPGPLSQRLRLLRAFLAGERRLQGRLTRLIAN